MFERPDHRLSLLAVLLLFTGMLAACVSEYRPNPNFAGCHNRSVDVYFEEWNSELNTHSRALLRTLQESLRPCHINGVRIVGMADAVGDSEANIEVSRKRSELIARFLQDGGWRRSKFDVVAIGERGAVVNGSEKLMRRRATVSVSASAPH
jgi:peptidoglycan-associated lipoprotein